MKAPLPAQETERIAALDRYQILDTQQEEAFDAITRLASDICQAPISLVSLLDANRQWFKSALGVEMSETPRESSFCAHTVVQGDFLLVPDTRLDSRFADNPLVIDEPHLRFYAAAALRTPDGHALGTLCVLDRRPRTLSPAQERGLRDLAAQVMAQLELRRAMREASQTRIELESINGRLQAKSVQLAESDRLKSEFLATLGHELRNPLAPIRSAAGILRRLDSELDPRVRELAAVIDRQSQHLAYLVDELLDAARISTGKINLQKEYVDIETVVRRAAEQCQPLVDERRHQLLLALPDEPVYLLADIGRLTQVFSNILHNAAKFTEPGGKITLAVTTSKEQVAVRISDTGMGIPPEMMPRIMELFSQSERAVDRAPGGLGIGLTIVERLVALHDGRLLVTSDGPGCGSTFTVFLPSGSPEQVGTSASSPPLAQRGTPRRVLIVDDNRDAVQMMSILLESSGYLTESLHDGMAVLEKVQSFAPDVVLLDLSLPGRDGYEVARALRRDRAGCAATLVALTGYGQPQDRLDTQAAGFDHHLVKPVDFDLLARILEQPGKP